MWFLVVSLPVQGIYLEGDGYVFLSSEAWCGLGGAGSGVKAFGVPQLRLCMRRVTGFFLAVGSVRSVHFDVPSLGEPATPGRSCALNSV